MKLNLASKIAKFSFIFLILIVAEGCSTSLSRTAPENGDAVSFPLTFSWDKSIGKCKKIGLLLLTSPVKCVTTKEEPVGSYTAVNNMATEYVMSAEAWSDFKDQNGQYHRYYWKLMWQDTFDEWWEHTEYWSFTEEGQKSQQQIVMLFDNLFSFKHYLFPETYKRKCSNPEDYFSLDVPVKRKDINQ